MKTLILSLVGTALLAGCSTKVVNEPPARGSDHTIIERDRPIVVQPAQPEQKPEVQNNIHVDR